MGSGTKCNQIGCDNPVLNFDDICATCGARYGKHFGYECPDEKGRFVPLKSADLPDLEALKALKLKEHGRGDPLPGAEGSEQNDPVARELLREIYPMMPKNFCMYHEIVAIISRYLQKARNECAAFEAYKVEYESRAIWIEKMNKILGYDNSDGFHSTPDPFEIAATLTAKAEGFKRLAAECDVLKESNYELRDQLCANTKLISELQHTVRLVQETHSQHIHECAVKAAGVLVDKFYGQIVDYAFRTKFQAIICEAFGAPAKDACEEAAEAAWEKGESPLDDCTTKAAFKVGFKAAWKLAKDDK